MSDPIWTPAQLVGFAVIFAVNVAFPGWPVLVAAAVVVVAYLVLLRVALNGIDAWYERVDRDTD
jgi:hypothetical protein